MDRDLSTSLESHIAPAMTLDDVDDFHASDCLNFDTDDDDIKLMNILTRFNNGESFEDALNEFMGQTQTIDPSLLDLSQNVSSSTWQKQNCKKDSSTPESMELPNLSPSSMNVVGLRNPANDPFLGVSSPFGSSPPTPCPKGFSQPQNPTLQASRPQRNSELPTQANQCPVREQKALMPPPSLPPNRVRKNRKNCQNQSVKQCQKSPVQKLPPNQLAQGQLPHAQFSQLPQVQLGQPPQAQFSQLPQAPMGQPPQFQMQSQMNTGSQQAMPQCQLPPAQVFPPQMDVNTMPQAQTKPKGVHLFSIPMQLIKGPSGGGQLVPMSLTPAEIQMRQQSGLLPPLRIQIDQPIPSMQGNAHFGPTSMQPGSIAPGYMCPQMPQPSMFAQPQAPWNTPQPQITGPSGPPSSAHFAQHQQTFSANPQNKQHRVTNPSIPTNSGKSYEWITITPERFGANPENHRR